MTPKQLKLLQQLSKIGEVVLINRSKESVIKALEKLDLNLLNHILDDSLTYQDVTKKVFLEKLNELFNELKERDTHLVSQNGFCNSEECSNKGIKGILFCGNNSGKHFNFIFEQNTDGRITDIFHCNKFQCESENAVDENKRELTIKVYEDEQAKFVPNSDYLNKNNYSLSAISE